jgi:hypothetical protein
MPNCLRRIVTAVICLAIGSYYLLAAQASGNAFVWNQDLGGYSDGYYDLLGRAFAHGHLYLPIQPSKELLALPNPWDPAANAAYRLHDAALFHGRYYLYHGPGPAVALFLPWRLVTGHDLPENFALFLLCFGGFAFSAAALIRVLDDTNAAPGPLLLSVMLVALGICQGVPYLFSRISVYEVAIAGGYFFVSAAIFFLVRGVSAPSSGWWFASGLMFGAAFACRPHLALAPAIAFLALLPTRRWRELGTFVAPLGIVGALVAGYNHVRFGDIFEFGNRYLLAGITDSRVVLAGHNIAPGLYYFLFCPPDFSPVFPWVRLVLRFPFDSPAFTLPPRYFLEPTSGVVWQAPFLIGVLALPLVRPFRARVVLWVVLGSAATVFLFVAATGFTTQRYEVDFLPIAVWVTLATLGSLIRPRGLIVALAPLVAGGAVVSLALGISGPNDDMLKRRPVPYLRLARLFSPIDRFRPLLNPEITAAFTAQFTAQPEHYREPLLIVGRQAFRHFLYAEHLGKNLRIASSRETREVEYILDQTTGKPAEFVVKYDPATRRISVAIDGTERLSQYLGNLVTAPGDVTIGENRIDPDITEPRFTGRITAASIRVIASTVR